MQTLAGIDFAALTQRAFHPSPAAWEDQVFYFASFEKRVGNAAPRPRVKGGRSPAERTLDVRNREIRWPVAGC
ncbi:MAG: hypothetical protein AB1720_08215, partial [Pseudomonadota bacterium]